MRTESKKMPTSLALVARQFRCNIVPGDRLHTRITSHLERLVVFTNPAQDCIAIEPVSHVNNAISLMARGVADADALGLRVLQPGESMSCEMSIQVEATQ